MNPNSRVLAPLGGANGRELLACVCAQMGRLGAMISGRSTTTFALQLAGGLWWNVGKREAVDQSQAAPRHDTGAKDDPIRRFYGQVKLTEPEIVSRRTLDVWAEGFLLGAADQGWITLPKRAPHQKQPKPKPADLVSLRKITWRQLRILAKKYRSMEKLHTALHPREEAVGGGIFKVLTRAINALEAPEDVPAECTPLLVKLGKLVGEAMGEGSPSHEAPPSRRNGAPHPALASARSHSSNPGSRTRGFGRANSGHKSTKNKRKE